MNSDGQLNFSSYTREQLVRALSRINRERYPLNFAALSKELESRTQVSEAESLAIEHGRRISSRIDRSKRTVTEYILLLSLVGFLVFWGALAVFGSIKISSGPKVAGVAQIAIVLVAGVAALYLVVARAVSGAVLCVVFYGIQVLSVQLHSGRSLHFNSLPAIQFRINGDPSAPITLNLVAAGLFLLSLRLVGDYRELKSASVQPPAA